MDSHWLITGKLRKINLSRINKQETLNIKTKLFISQFNFLMFGDNMAKLRERTIDLVLTSPASHISMFSRRTSGSCYWAVMNSEFTCLIYCGFLFINIVFHAVFLKYLSLLLLSFFFLLLGINCDTQFVLPFEPPASIVLPPSVRMNFSWTAAQVQSMFFLPPLQFADPWFVALCVTIPSFVQFYLKENAIFLRLCT